MLLLLVTGAWAADRTGRPKLAGALLGAAATIKLFPVYLLIYYLLRGRWTIVISGFVTVAALTLITAAILGVGAYRDYVRVVLPAIQWFRVGWENQSLDGFWSRLFDGAPETPRNYSRSRVLWYDPAVARGAYWASAVVITLVMAMATRRARTRYDEDRAFGVAATAMLLLSPILWEHYLLLLLVPLGVLWADSSRRVVGRVALTTLTIILFISPRLVWTAFDLGGKVARPIDNVTVIPYQCYALLGLFVLGICDLGGGQAPLPRRGAGPP